MTTSHQGTEQTKAHVLVVDDEPELYQMVAICLRQSGFRITTADNAADAYNLLMLEPYDAIVSDVMMPGENGVTFLGRVHQTWPDIPVVLMTGYAQLQMAVDAIKNGAFDFVHKPFDFDHMRKIVERAVNYTKLQRLEKNYRDELEKMVALRTAELENAMVELDFARTALLKRANEKNEFMSNISHEMRTPMNGVVGGLSLLEDEVTTAKGKEYLEIVRQSTDNMLVLVDQLLTFGRWADKSGEVACYDLTCLAAVLNDVVAEFRAAYEQKGICLKLRVATDVPREIWTDKDILKRLFEILLGNALKFTNKGSVTLEVSHDKSGENGGGCIFP